MTDAISYINQCMGEIYQHQRTHYGEEPTMIIMRPETWYKMAEECHLKVSGLVNLTRVEPYFRGIKIYRSLDVDMDTIICK